jgi:glycosyltransferase involved in cell wall biosynthesis
MFISVRCKHKVAACEVSKALVLNKSFLEILGRNIDSEVTNNSKLPILSVITPVYNGSNFIEETVFSVLKAINNRRIEYIVVNDGSKDETLTKLEVFKDRIIIMNQNNRGESAAVNAGLKRASAELVLVVSADDPLFTDEIFDGVESFFRLHPEVVALYPDWRKIDEKGNIKSLQKLSQISDLELIGLNRCTPGPGTIFRRSQALKIGGRDEDLKYSGDYDFWLRLSRHGLLSHRSRVLAQWREHSNSTSVNSITRRMAEERIYVIERFLSTHEIDKKITRMAYGSAYYFAAALSFHDSSIPAKKYLYNAFRLRRNFVENAKLKVIIFILISPASHVIYRLFRSLSLFR